MRELKFRQARCGAKGNFVDWFYWGFLDDGSGLHFVAPLQHNVDNYQFTGLKDKNDKEIYEGDIVQRRTTHSQPKLIVEWKEIGWNPFEDDLCDLGNVACYEIIGNIHQHPNLLEQDNARP